MYLKILNRWTQTLYINTLHYKLEAENMAENPSLSLHCGKSPVVQLPGQAECRAWQAAESLPRHRAPVWGTAGTLLCTTALGTGLHPRLHSLQPSWDTQLSGLCSDAAAPKTSSGAGLFPQ